MELATAPFRLPFGGHAAASCRCRRYRGRTDVGCVRGEAAVRRRRSSRRPPARCSTRSEGRVCGPSSSARSAPSRRVSMSRLASARRGLKESPRRSRRRADDGQVLASWRLTGELSTGTRRIVEPACLLASDPEVVVLDEPSGGVAQKETEALGPLIGDLRSPASGCCEGCARPRRDRGARAPGARSWRSALGSPCEGRSTPPPGCPRIWPTLRPCPA